MQASLVSQMQTPRPLQSFCEVRQRRHAHLAKRMKSRCFVRAAAGVTGDGPCALSNEWQARAWPVRTIATRSTTIQRLAPHDELTTTLARERSNCTADRNSPVRSRGEAAVSIASHHQGLMPSKVKNTIQELLELLLTLEQSQI